eukprot:12991109-Alexandrium_andersonii.AAC.1
MALAMGCPVRVLRAWFAYMMSMSCHNAVGGSVGVPFTRLCAIPQGCPLSMMRVAMLARLFVMMSRIAG